MPGLVAPAAKGEVAFLADGKKLRGCVILFGGLGLLLFSLGGCFVLVSVFTVVVGRARLV